MKGRERRELEPEEVSSHIYTMVDVLRKKIQVQQHEHPAHTGLTISIFRKFACDEHF